MVILLTEFEKLANLIDKGARLLCHQAMNVLPSPFSHVSDILARTESLFVSHDQAERQE